MNWSTLLFVFALFAFPLGAIQAQTATATLSGADTVRQGETLQLTFAFENIDAKGFELPALVGLTVVAGPSTQTSMRIMNGIRSSSSAFAYQVVAEQSGLAYVPAVTLEHDGEEIKTDALTVYITEDPSYVPLQQGAQPQQHLQQPKKRKRPTVKL